MLIFLFGDKSLQLWQWNVLFITKTTTDINIVVCEWLKYKNLARTIVINQTKPETSVALLGLQLQNNMKGSVRGDPCVDTVGSF